jgi:hypothetical protein
MSSSQNSAIVISLVRISGSSPPTQPLKVAGIVTVVHSLQNEISGIRVSHVEHEFAFAIGTELSEFPTSQGGI